MGKTGNKVLLFSFDIQVLQVCMNVDELTNKEATTL